MKKPLPKKQAAKQKQTDPTIESPRPDCYTSNEWSRLLKLKEKLAYALRKYDLGKFNETTAADFIATTSGKVFRDTTNLDESEIAEYHRRKGPMYADLGRMAFEAFCKDDAQFFDNIALWIKRRRGDAKQMRKGANGAPTRTLKTLTYPMLGIKRSHGRGGASHHRSLEVVFKTALFELIEIRQISDSMRRISRAELKKRVMMARRSNDVEINESRLSELISDNGLAAFLA